MDILRPFDEVAIPSLPKSWVQCKFQVIVVIDQARKHQKATQIDTSFLSTDRSIRKEHLAPKKFDAAIREAYLSLHALLGTNGEARSVDGAGGVFCLSNRHLTGSHGAGPQLKNVNRRVAGRSVERVLLACGLEDQEFHIAEMRFQNDLCMKTHILKQRNNLLHRSPMGSNLEEGTLVVKSAAPVQGTYSGRVEVRNEHGTFRTNHLPHVLRED